MAGKGLSRVPAGTKQASTHQNGELRRVDPMDPRVPLRIDGKPIFPDAPWSSAYFLFDMAAEIWLESVSGKTMGYFEPSAGAARPISDSLLWYVAGLRDWHRDGYDEHPDEDDLAVKDLAKRVTQKSLVALSFCANTAWAIVIPDDMQARMRDQTAAASKPVIRAGLELGWDLPKVLDAAGVTMGLYIQWLAADAEFRATVDAILARQVAGQVGSGGDAVQGLTGPESGVTATPDAGEQTVDPLLRVVGSDSGPSPASTSASPTPNSGA